MPKELRNPRHVAKLPKYGHDLSKILKFSSNVGQLLPVWYDLAQAGDKYKYNTEMFTQVTDIVSPAMIHLEEHVEWFFVPLRQLYQFADDNLYSLDNSRTSYRENISDKSVLPLLQEEALFFHVTLVDAILGNLDVSDLEDDVDDYGFPNRFNRIRLLQHLGYGRSFNVETPDLSTRGYNIMFLLAYQKIFYDKYRITDRTPNNVKAYNVDDLSGLANMPDQRVKDILQLHYRPWRKDFFTNVFVSPLIDVDAVGMQQATRDRENSLEKFNNWLINSSAALANNEGGENTGNPTTVQQLNTEQTITPFSLALLRGMFAVEKLSEITRRAAKRYDAQVLAHFGFKVPEGIGTEVISCGSDKSIMRVNEIVAQSSGSATAQGSDVNTTFGERGGTASGYNQNKNKEFTAPCDGILMAIYSAEPLADYDDRPFDRFNTFSTRADYFKPEYDRLGMAPLFWYQLYGTYYDDTDVERNILGWQYRFMEYKMKFNQCLGAFVHTEWKNWTIFRDTYSGDILSLPNKFFYINPSIMDNILLVHTSYTGTEVIKGLETVYERDCLLHWFKFNVFKSSVISNYSLPSL